VPLEGTVEEVQTIDIRPDPPASPNRLALRTTPGSGAGWRPLR
jgi:hypothetical protein